MSELEVASRLAKGRRQLSDEVAEHVRSMVLAGKYRPGDFLRHEKLAAELGISVTPVREALLALRGEGFLRLEARRGFVVAPLNRRDFEDLYTMQATVAGQLAGRAAAAMSESVCEELIEVQNRLEKAAASQKFAVVEELNEDFHRVINRSAESAKLGWLLNSILNYLPTRYYADMAGMTNMTIADHRKILDAIQVNNSEAAAQSMHDHTMNSLNAFLTHLDSEGVWS